MQLKSDNKTNLYKSIKLCFTANITRLDLNASEYLGSLISHIKVKACVNYLETVLIVISLFRISGLTDQILTEFQFFVCQAIWFRYS